MQPQKCVDSFLKGREQDEHSVRDVAHEDGGRKTGQSSGTVAPAGLGAR